MFKYLFMDKVMLGSTLGVFLNEIKNHVVLSQPSYLQEAPQEGTHLLQIAGHRKSLGGTVSHSPWLTSSVEL